MTDLSWVFKGAPFGNKNAAGPRGGSKDSGKEHGTPLKDGNYGVDDTVYGKKNSFGDPGKIGKITSIQDSPVAGTGKIVHLAHPDGSKSHDLAVNLRHHSPSTKSEGTVSWGGSLRMGS